MAEHVEELAVGPAGTVTIAPNVLVTIARLSALSVSGVCRMSAHTPVRLLSQSSAGEGVRVRIVEHSVTVDLFIVVKSGESMLQVGQAVQSSVARAIREMVGMEVGEVNVHVGDVEFPCPEWTPPEA